MDAHEDNSNKLRVIMTGLANHFGIAGQQAGLYRLDSPIPDRKFRHSKISIIEAPPLEFKKPYQRQQQNGMAAEETEMTAKTCKRYGQIRKGVRCGEMALILQRNRCYICIFCSDFGNIFNLDENTDIKFSCFSLGNFWHAKPSVLL